MSEKPLLHISDLAVNLGGRAVLRDINLDISPGELLCVIGPNGAGKTTLIRAIMGLLPLAAGKIELQGGVGYVPQRQDADWSYPISVEQVVLTSLKPRFLATAAQWRKVYQALEKVQLLDLRQRNIGELSGGQKQRVLIARALVSQPELLLLDEPFTGLDHPNQDLLAELCQQLKAAGISILMSTHDLAQAAEIADRMLILNRRVRALAPLAELTDPQLWAESYGVDINSPLVRMMSALIEKPTAVESRAESRAESGKEQK